MIRLILTWLLVVPFPRPTQEPPVPQVIPQWTNGTPGPHLGERIEFEQLPKDIQRHVLARIAPEDNS